MAFTRRGLGDEERDGVEVRRAAPRWRLSNTPLDPGFRRRVAGEIAAWKPDLVVGHTPVPFPAEMASLAAERAGVPFVVTYHAGRLEGGTPLLDAAAALDRATFEARMLRGAARIVAVSPFVRDRTLAAHRAKVEVVPPGVDADHFAPDGPPRGADVLFVGPLDGAYRWKGLDVLWRAFPRVAARVPGARLVLVGEGDRRGELERRAAAEGLGGAVVFRGRLAPDDLARAYQRCAVAVLPSTSDAESFGMVLAEANACGRPVVGTRVGGIPSFVQDGENGLLVPPGDAAALADALARVLLDPGLAARMGDAGRVRVLREHDWKALAERTEAIYAACAARLTAP